MRVARPGFAFLKGWHRYVSFSLSRAVVDNNAGRYQLSFSSEGRGGYMAYEGFVRGIGEPTPMNLLGVSEHPV